MWVRVRVNAPICWHLDTQRITLTAGMLFQNGTRTKTALRVRTPRGWWRDSSCYKLRLFRTRKIGEIKKKVKSLSWLHLCTRQNLITSPSHFDHMELRRSDESLDEDWGEQSGLLGGTQSVGDTSLTSAPCEEMWPRTTGRIRLSAAEGLGHSHEAQIKPRAA